MFALRIFNPYDSVPTSPDYHVLTTAELKRDLDKARTLYDVSQYLAEKIEKNYQERLLRKSTQAKQIWHALKQDFDK